MASPTVNSVKGANQTAGSANSLTCDYPASGIASGDTLIALGSADGNPSDLIWLTSDGWTNLAISGGVTAQGRIAYKKADGTEDGTTTTLTTDDAEQKCGRIWAISGASDPTVTAPEQGTWVDGSSNIDPPSLTPSGGSDDYLFIAFYAHNDTNLATGYPTNYDDNQATQATSSGGGSADGVATRALTASSDDPGAFTNSTNAAKGQTIAIYPVAAGGATPFKPPSGLALLGMGT